MIDQIFLQLMPHFIDLILAFVFFTFFIIFFHKSIKVEYRFANLIAFGFLIVGIGYILKISLIGSLVFTSFIKLAGFVIILLGASYDFFKHIIFSKNKFHIFLHSLTIGAFLIIMAKFVEQQVLFSNLLRLGGIIIFLEWFFRHQRLTKENKFVLALIALFLFLIFTSSAVIQTMFNYYFEKKYINQNTEALNFAENFLTERKDKLLKKSEELINDSNFKEALKSRNTEYLKKILAKDGDNTFFLLFENEGLTDFYSINNEENIKSPTGSLQFKKFIYSKSEGGGIISDDNLMYVFGFAKGDEENKRLIIGQDVRKTEIITKIREKFNSIFIIELATTNSFQVIDNNTDIPPFYYSSYLKIKKAIIDNQRGDYVAIENNPSEKYSVSVGRPVRNFSDQKIGIMASNSEISELITLPRIVHSIAWGLLLAFGFSIYIIYRSNKRT